MEDCDKQLFEDIREVLLAARGKAQTAINFAMVVAYWKIGQLIVDRQGGRERAAYGNGLIEGLATPLSREFGKSLDARELRRMRQFYLTYPIRESLRPELGWTHYRLLLSVESDDARGWYLKTAADEGWTTRQLQRQIGALYYERMQTSPDPSATRSDALIQFGKDGIEASENIIKSPYVLEFLGVGDLKQIHESDIEQGIINHLEEFLLELGKGFCYVARQKLIRMDERDFYIDLVFYNCILKCYVLIDLKLGELTYQDIGQMDGYVRLYEERFRRHDDNPTIGLVLCSKKNEAVAHYSVLNESKQIFASKYLLHLPSEDDLKREIERERLLLDRDGTASQPSRDF